MQRFALRVAYDGRAFHGSQRQPGLRTVEGDLIEACTKVGAIVDADGAKFLAASRTDRGVSAAGNVFALDTTFRPEELAGAVNSRLADAWVLAVAEAPEGFNPRASASRRYVYFQPRSGVRDVGTFAAALARFEGAHDFSAFARVEAHRSPQRVVHVARASAQGAFVRCEIEAPSFLWNQVRRMVAAALAVDAGVASLADVDAALRDPASGKDWGVAPPEPLVLASVAHPGLAWREDARLSERVARAFAERIAAIELSLALARELTGGAPR